MKYKQKPKCLDCGKELKTLIIQKMHNTFKQTHIFNKISKQIKAKN